MSEPITLSRAKPYLCRCGRLVYRIGVCGHPSQLCPGCSIKRRKLKAKGDDEMSKTGIGPV